MNRLLLPTPLLFLLVGVAHPQGFSPEQAVERMKVADGLRVRLVASEPMIRQPVTMTFDDRGRLWVIQYLQYPTPNGLKPVKVDQYLRTTWDRLPEPPPKGPRGADRITILSDPDENGRYRKSKDFVTGLNLATALALGHGGVWVVQSPYLLFYPDRDGDDVPDGDPEVHLTGFGMEDSHAYANSIQWGPDGWLYGAQGSTVTANIRGIEFQQGLWRYHPRTKQFELFAEGGGNTWGLDFDRHGHAIASTNYGGRANLHQVQGGYYVKGFGKHGPLHNPHTYGYFDHIPYPDFQGGHVTCGGIVYRGGALPEKYHHQFLAANLLSNVINWHVLERKGSSFTARHGGTLLDARDSWFRPIDCLTGPDGAVYVADWYDARANHVDPVDTWDRTNGRIYRLESTDATPLPAFDLRQRSSRELVELLTHRNDWYVREARRLLSERRDPTVLPELRRLAIEGRDQVALEALWTLASSDAFDEALAFKLLKHSHEDVRAWAVRLVGDAKRVSPAMRDQFVELARTEGSATVRSQLACTAKRLPADDALSLAAELLRRADDVNDPHIPLLIWWAIEDKAVSDRERVLALFETQEIWNRPMVRRHLIERVGRRYMAEGSDAGLAACSRLLARAPDAETMGLLVRGMEAALEGRSLPQPPAALEKQLETLWQKQSADLSLVRFALRLGSSEAYRHTLQRVSDAKAPSAERIALIDVLGQLAKTDAVPVLIAVLKDNGPTSVRGAALLALQAFPDPAIASEVLTLYPRLPADLRGKAQTLLCSRPASALDFLNLVETKVVDPKEVPLDQLRKLVAFNKDDITQKVEKHWGKVAPATAGEKLARIRNLSAVVIRRGKGDPVAGKPLFTKHCASCHTLFGEGNKIGPELTGADRKNLDFLMSNVVDPSGYMRPEYVPYNVTLKDGRTLDGLMVESTPATITLVNAKNERTVVRREQIEELATSPISLMPEKLLDTLKDQEIRDLFAYLQSDGQ